MKRIVSAALAFFASFGLACVVMTLLLVLVLLGTLEQTRSGIYEVQQRYFAAPLVVHEFPGGLRLPLPGGGILMPLFALNLALGMFMRHKLRLDRLGLWIAHGGMLFLLLGGLITRLFAVEGQMSLLPGESSDTFASYFEWELVVMEQPGDAAPREFTAALEPLEDRLAAGALRIETPAALPFSVTIEDYARHSVPRRAGTLDAPAEAVAEGFVLQPLRLEKEAERNAPGALVSIRTDAGAEHRVLLWGFAAAPWTIDIDGARYGFWLRRHQWQVPFTVELTRFTREFHPGTQMPRKYESDIVKIEEGVRQPVSIRMNQPLRHAGYTFFQASFFEDPATGELASVFAVVRNPADQWPLYACWIVTVGLLVHFAIRLTRHLAREKGRRPAS